MFTEELKTEQEIADILNQQGVLTDLNRTWTKATVNQVLTNEKYIGNNVSNRISFKLKTKRVVNPESEWIRKEGAFEAIVDPSVFYIAKGIINARARRFSNDELLQKLKDLQAKKGYLLPLSSTKTPICRQVPSIPAALAAWSGLISLSVTIQNGITVLLKLTAFCAGCIKIFLRRR